VITKSIFESKAKKQKDKMVDPTHQSYHEKDSTGRVATTIETFQMLGGIQVIRDTF
jgi:hypothetical protein